MRNLIGTRMQLHARQCLLELVAFPEAACLVFAVFDYAPGEDISNRNYDSVLHRLNRVSAMNALDELQTLGLVDDFARDVPNAEVGSTMPTPKVLGVTC